MEINEWCEELAQIMNGFYEDGCLLVDPDGSGMHNSYAGNEIMQLYKNNLSPKEAAGVLMAGGMP